MARSFRCPIDGKEYNLPKHLFTHARFKSDPEKHGGKWRYRTETGKSPVDIRTLIHNAPTKITTAEAIEMAMALHAEYHPDLVAEQAASTISKGSILYHFHKFEKVYPQRTKQNWKDVRSACRRLCEEVGDVPLHEINKQVLQEALHTLAPNAQAKVRTCMARFFDQYLFDYEYCPQFRGNPFVKGNRDSVRYTDTEEAKTNRLRMLKSELRTIIETAEENDDEWLADALRISFLLGIRCNDVVSMRWDNYRPKSNEILIDIHKSINSLGEKRGVRFLITGESHPEVMDIIRGRYLKRAVTLQERRTRYGVEIAPAIVERAEYVFNRRPERLPKKMPKGKEQYSQIDSKYYSRRFKDYRRAIDDIKTREIKEQGYICLHEVRSLFARVAYVKGERKNGELIREALAHQSRTKGTMENHYLDMGETITPECLVTLDDLYGPEIDEKFQDFGEIEEAIGEE